MTMPSDEDLVNIHDESGNPKGYHARYLASVIGIAAVKRSVIEALAREADEMAANERVASDAEIDEYLADWLRSHIPDRT